MGNAVVEDTQKGEGGADIKYFLFSVLYLFLFYFLFLGLWFLNIKSVF